MGQSHAIVHRHAIERNKRQDVGRAETWMFARVRAHVDQFRRALHRLHGRFDYLLGRSDERDHRTVVVGIDVRVEHTRRRDRANRLRDAAHRLGPAALAEIGDTFD